MHGQRLMREMVTTVTRKPGTVVIGRGKLNEGAETNNGKVLGEAV